MPSTDSLDISVFQDIISKGVDTSVGTYSPDDLLTPIPIIKKKQNGGPLSVDTSRQCTAHLRDGSGKRCRKPAVLGTTVCASHGGAAPQVKRSAKQKLAELIEPALAGLRIALESNEISSIIKAAQIVLDRTGFHPSQAIELTGKDGNPIQVQQATIDVNNLPIEIREELLKQAKRLIVEGEKE